VDEREVDVQPIGDGRHSEKRVAGVQYYNLRKYFYIYVCNVGKVSGILTKK
jgi:hypothetical protein